MKVFFWLLLLAGNMEHKNQKDAEPVGEAMDLLVGLLYISGRNKGVWAHT